jgi:hypothetical protein
MSEFAKVLGVGQTHIELIAARIEPRLQIAAGAICGECRHAAIAGQR